MNPIVVNEVRKGFYLDSVALMRFSRTIASLGGVEEAALMMGTPSNRQIMTDAGLLDENGNAAEGGDLVIGIRARDKESAKHALAEAQRLLTQPTAAAGEMSEWRPRTLRAALKQAPDSNLALISVPGDFAIAEARKAIRRGLHAMIFSDNVPLADEAALKREARELGRLVMGPDCGTAIINGTPLAFANVVSRGGIGIVGASGTGTQEVSCLIEQYGHGVSHAIGVGGRDLKSEVGGVSTLMALDALEADTQTQHIVIVSKPPPDDIARTVLDRVGMIGKPATICFVGSDRREMPGNARQAFTLRDAARMACGLDLEHATEAPADLASRVPPSRPGLRGLFAGGTLCAEAQVIFTAGGVAVTSNAPVPGVAQAGKGEGHRLLDLGEDEYTRGKPHPMIDPTVRDAPLVDALKDSQTGVILLDVVIGYGAHADPAGHLAAVLEKCGKSDVPLVIASVTGTEQDPQGRSAQIAKLGKAGVCVAPTNADAAAWSLSALRTQS